VGTSGDGILRRHHPIWVSSRIIASFKVVAISMFCCNLKSCGIGRISQKGIPNQKSPPKSQFSSEFRTSDLFTQTSVRSGSASFSQIPKRFSKSISSITSGPNCSFQPEWLFEGMSPISCPFVIIRRFRIVVATNFRCDFPPVWSALVKSTDKPDSMSCQDEIRRIAGDSEAPKREIFVRT